MRELDQSRCSLHDRRFVSQAGRTRYFARSVTRARSARRGEEKNKAPVIALDFCCIYIGLVFIKDSEIWVLRFRDLGSSFSSFGVFVFECFVFETTVVRAYADVITKFSILYSFRPANSHGSAVSLTVFYLFSRPHDKTPQSHDFGGGKSF